MKKSPIFQEHTLSAKTPAKVSTTPNLLPLKISPDDDHTNLENSAMPFMPTLYSPKGDDEEEKQIPLLDVANEHQSLSLPLPTMLPDPFSLEDHLSMSPFAPQGKKRSHNTFVLRPRRIDRIGMETPYLEVGADNLPRKRPRMPLFVSIDDDAHSDHHYKNLGSHGHASSALEAFAAFASDSASDSSWPSQPYISSSITPGWSCQIDDITKRLKSTDSHVLSDDVQVNALEQPTNQVHGPTFGEAVIALPRVFRPTIRRMTTSPSKSHNAQGVPRAFVPSSTSAFSASQCAEMAITPSSKPESPFLSR